MDPGTSTGAAADGGLRLLYRPVMNLSNGRITAVSPVVSTGDGASLTPADIWDRWPDLGFELLERVASDVAQWRDAGSALTLIVPVTASLLDERLARNMYASLRNAELSMEDLVVEVDAEVFGDEDRTALWAVQDLTSLGARVAASRFGEGPWPVNGMIEAGASQLVLDMNSVKVPGDSDALAAAIVSTGKALGWAVRAENVTRVAELSFLTKIKCEFAQGDRLAPATAAEGITAHLQAQRAAAPATAELTETG
ncbi:MAG: EAL domain-containing protein [Acidimicrobiales bacterium]